MSKYIIDLRPDCKVVQQICASNENVNVGARSVGLFDALTDDYIKENFKYLLDAEYQRGLEDAWDAARKIAAMWETMDNDDLLETFGVTKKIGESVIGTLFKKQTANEAMLKLEAYEEKQKADDKIEVGDEVKSLSDSGVEIEGLLPWVVTTVDQGDYCQGIDSKGEVHATKKVRACKTGRHFDIDKILEEMRHD